MPSSNLIRLGGLAAVLGAVLLITVSLAQLVLNLLSPGPGAVSDAAIAALYVQSVFGLLGRTLVVLGLVGLYLRQSVTTGAFGLVGFLAAFFGMTLPAGLEWAAVLTTLGWTLFGIASLQAGIYPRTAAILLIVGVVASWVFNHLLAAPAAGGLGSWLVYAGIGAEIVRNVAIGWLGYSLFSGRDVAVERPGS
jgi:hypothetical protein